MSYRDPKPEELQDLLFERIWQTIKTWDINVPAEYSGYTEATGNHVCAILDVVRDETDKLWRISQAVKLQRQNDLAGLQQFYDYVKGVVEHQDSD